MTIISTFKKTRTYSHQGYKNLINELIIIHNLSSELELLRWYYSSELNIQVSKERRLKRILNRKRGDKYLLFPRLRVIQECEKVGSIDDFFTQESVIQQGLTLKKFTNYLRQLKQNYQNSIKIDKLLT